MSVTASNDNGCEDNLHFDACIEPFPWPDPDAWGYTDCPTKYEGTQAHPGRTCTQSVIELNANRVSGPPSTHWHVTNWVTPLAFTTLPI